MILTGYQSNQKSQRVKIAGDLGSCTFPLEETTLASQRVPLFPCRHVHVHVPARVQEVEDVRVQAAGEAVHLTVQPGRRG